MKTFPRQWLVAAIAMFAFAGVTTQALAEDTATGVASDTISDSGISASTYFTDEFGNRRNPTDEERAELSARFQKDLAKMMGKNRGNSNVKQHANGSVSATVALSKMQFLVVQENPDGSRTFDHASLDENGNVNLPPVNSLPEE